jgi:hypothetical protein
MVQSSASSVVIVVAAALIAVAATPARDPVGVERSQLAGHDGLSAMIAGARALEGRLGSTSRASREPSTLLWEPGDRG